MSKKNYSQVPPEVREQIRALYREGKSRSEIRAIVKRSYETVCVLVRDLPDNGTTNYSFKKSGGWPVPNEKIEEVIKGFRYEDVDELSLYREWPHTIPLNGDRLKFAAHERNRPWGCSQYGA